MCESTVFIVGPPRSGTTWVSEVLSEGAGLLALTEPDNEKSSLLALPAKRDLTRFPFLPMGGWNAAYENLWRRVAAGGRGSDLLSRSRLTQALLAPQPLLELYVQRKEERVTARLSNHIPNGDASSNTLTPTCCQCGGAGRMIKSVHGVFSTEWISARMPHARVVIALRNPYGVLASWRRLRMPDAVRKGCFLADVQRAAFGSELPTPATTFERMCLQLATMYAHLESAAARHPDWVVVRHEDLCVEPELKFERLFRALGLEWTTKARDAVTRRNTAGSGFRTNRVASRELGKWRSEYSPAEKATLDDTLRITNNAHWLTV